jgi:hypothetical protein
MDSLTPLTKRLALIVLTVCVVTALICRDSQVATLLAGGLLIIINPKD